VLERGDREAQRLLALLLLGFVVEVGAPVVDLAEPLDRAGLKEQVLGERGLATAGVTRQDDTSEVCWIDALHRHRRVYLTLRGCRGDGDGGSRKRPRGQALAAVRPF
jgi:hypothetical protein